MTALLFAEYKQNCCHVIALSNNTKFDLRSNLIQKIASAMEEAIDQDTMLVFPDNNDAFLIHRAHQELADKSNSKALCTLPLINNHKIFGSIILFRDSEECFDKKTVNMFEQTMSLITPYLALKQSEERSLSYKLWTKTKKCLAGIFGINFLKIKLIFVSGHFINFDFDVDRR